jgi:hypothetical protein
MLRAGARGWAALFGAFVVSCSTGFRIDAGDTQERYSYAGCEAAGTQGCPNDLVFSCALHVIQAKYSTCTTAADCVTVSLTNCVDTLSSCPPAAVNTASATAFRSEADAESQRYCGTQAPCHEAGDCALSFSAGRVDCVNARCVALTDHGGP